jgi:hypothetical protein
VKIAAKKNAIAIEKIDSSTFMLRPSDSVAVVKPDIDASRFAHANQSSSRMATLFQ